MKIYCQTVRLPTHAKGDEHILFQSSRVLSKLSRYECVSFDIFDTLIKRNTAKPSDIFHLVEERHNAIPTFSKITGYRETRCGVERELRGKHPMREVSLDEIYDAMSFLDAEKEVLKQLEIDIELEACIKNQSLYPFYQECIRQKKKVIIVSDMYLPQAVIKTILHKNDITGYDRLYLSSEVGVKKKSGALWRHVLDETGISPKRILHIGDNKRSDILRAMEKGIRVAYIPKDAVHTQYISSEQMFESTLQDGLVYSFINNHVCLYQNEGHVFRLGYELLGPLIFGFCQWIHERSMAEHIDRLMFLARDCYLMEKAYKTMFPGDDSKCEYVHFSRKSLRIPYLITTKNTDRLQDVFPLRMFTIQKIIEGLGFEAEDYRAVCEQDGLSLKTTIWPSDISKYEALSKALMKTILEQSKDLELLLRYLQQINMIGRIGILDVGWHGTIQHALDVILSEHGIDSTTIGLYCGISRRGTFAYTSRGQGYWFDDQSDKNTNETYQRLAIAFILEVMLFPQEGTTVGYREKDGIVQPMRAKNEQIANAWVDAFQAGAMQFVSDYHEHKLTHEPMPMLTSNRPYFMLTYHPHLHEANEMGDLRYENLDVTYVAKPESRRFYLTHPRRFFRDYAAARWKEAFLKRLFPVGVNCHAIASLVKMRNVFKPAVQTSKDVSR